LQKYNKRFRQLIGKDSTARPLEMAHYHNYQAGVENISGRFTNAYMELHRAIEYHQKKWLNRCISATFGLLAIMHFKLVFLKKRGLMPIAQYFI